MNFCLSSRVREKSKSTHVSCNKALTIERLICELSSTSLTHTREARGEASEIVYAVNHFDVLLWMRMLISFASRAVSQM